MKKLIFVCSPYSNDIEYNTKYAIKCSRKVVERGHIPLAPHLLLPQFMSEETEREVALDMGMQMMTRCDEVWVFGETITSGMLEEIEFAKNNAIITNYGKMPIEDVETNENFDIINKPRHYNLTKYEPIEVIEDWGLPYHLGNVIKYIARCEYKGNKLQDLQKANFYLRRYVKLLEEGDICCEEIDG